MLNPRLNVTQPPAVQAPWFTAATWFFALFLLTLPLKFGTALNNIGLYTSLLLWLISLWRGELQHPRMTPALWALFAYLLTVSGAIAINQIDTERSFNSLKGNLLEQVYCLIFFLYHLRNRHQPWSLLTWLLAGFVLLNLCTLPPALQLWINGSHNLTVDMKAADINPGYGINAQFYLPLLLGYSLFAPLIRWQRILLWLLCLLSLILTALYDMSTALFAVMAYALCLAVGALVQRLRLSARQVTLAAAMSLAAGVGLFMAVAKDSTLEKIAGQYQLISSGQYYELLSARGGLWALAWDCARDAPLYGYGYGEKKVQLICSQDRYVHHAEQRGNQQGLRFVVLKYGQFNFHNQYLENIFVAGWLGSLCWMALFALSLRRAWSQRHQPLIAWLVVPGLIIYLFGCLFNGLWEGPPVSKALMLLLALANATPVERLSREHL